MVIKGDIMNKKVDIIDLALVRLGQKGLLHKKNWLELVIDEMIKIRDRILKNEAQTKRSKKRWNKEVI